MLNFRFRTECNRGCRDERTGERLIYLDVETQRTAASVGGWDKLDKLGVSVAVTYSPKLYELKIFAEHNLDELSAILHEADTVVGYNVIDFDFKVLQGYKQADVSNLHVFDLMLEIQKALGHRLPLSNLRAATLGYAPQYDALDMVKFWVLGDMEKVFEGCCSDVLAMLALHQYGITHGEVLYFAGADKRLTKLKVDW